MAERRCFFQQRNLQKWNFRSSRVPAFSLGKRGGEKAELCRKNYCVCIKPFELSLPVITNILLVEEKKVLRKNHARFSKKKSGILVGGLKSSTRTFENYMSPLPLRYSVEGFQKHDILLIQLLGYWSLLLQLVVIPHWLFVSLQKNVFWGLRCWGYGVRISLLDFFFFFKRAC